MKKYKIKTLEKINQTFQRQTYNNAITLIALIITIIVLLILAGVTINMVIGESGIFGKANNASEQTKIANAEEIIKTAVLENEVYKKTGDANAKSDTNLLNPVKEKLQQEGYTINDDNTITIGKTTINIPEEIASASTGGNGSSGGNVTIADGDNTQGTEAKTIDGKKATYSNPIIPAGFKAVDNSIDNTIDINANWTNGEGYKYGLVIEDKEENQFVWIAVDGVNVILNRYEFDKSSNLDGLELSKYVEKDDNWDEWKNKVNEYGGYYIGRYEAQYINGITNIPTVSLNKTTAQNYSKNVAIKNEYKTVTTNLLNSYMWDTTLKYIDFYTKSNFSGISKIGNTAWKNKGILTVASVADDIKCNIADLCGNVREWTTEYDNYHSAYVYRGACFNSYEQTSRRDNYWKTGYNDIGYRVALYWN